MFFLLSLHFIFAFEPCLVFSIIFQLSTIAITVLILFTECIKIECINFVNIILKKLYYFFQFFIYQNIDRANFNLFSGHFWNRKRFSYKELNIMLYLSFKYDELIIFVLIVSLLFFCDLSLSNKSIAICSCVFVFICNMICLRFVIGDCMSIVD